jgi:antitoxin CcdA
MKKQTTLSLSQELVRVARELDVNMSQSAEVGIRQAIKDKLTANWQAENRHAITAWNNRVATQGTYLKPEWLNE